MKLFYYQRPDGQPNFGDELNNWLWNKLYEHCTAKHSESTFLDEDASTAFLGTGTLLNDKLKSRIPRAKHIVIFGTGAGYEKPLSQLPTTWDIRCVRGPFSARLLGLSPDHAITDGGLLVSQVFQPTAAVRQQGYSFMPHIHSANDAAERWQHICQEAGIRYIDPRWPIEKVLNTIHTSEGLLAEAMHGAIVADALRVPWIPITTSPRIYAFKWQDWCASMRLPYFPHRIPPLTDYPRWARGVRSGTLATRHWLRAGLESPFTTAHYALFNNEQAIVRRLQNIVNKQQPYLSKESVFEARLESLQACFEDFLEDCRQRQLQTSSQLHLVGF